MIWSNRENKIDCKKLLRKNGLKTDLIRLTIKRIEEYNTFYNTKYTTCDNLASLINLNIHWSGTEEGRQFWEDVATGMRTTL